MQELILTHEEILDVISKMGEEITEKLKDEKGLPVFVVVMKGALNFMGDLMESVKRDILVDYIQISSYEGTSSSGSIKLIKNVSLDLKGKTVVIVEDIVDTGLSMDYLKKYIDSKYHPKRILIAALFNKVALRKVDVNIDFVGINLKENKFLVGYGLDYNGLGRNIPYVFVPTPEEVKAWDKELALEE